MKNQSLPVWKTVRFVLNNLFSNKITYVRNAAFLKFLYHLLAFEFYQPYLKALFFYRDKVILILAI